MKKRQVKLNTIQRTIAIGQLQVVQVAYAFHVHPKVITNLSERYRQTGSALMGYAVVIISVPRH